METINKLNVFFGDRQVGTLALYQRRLAAFEYAPEWIRSGFPISPFKLPLRSGVFIPKYDPFDGLFGIFSDSLPDGWGRLLVDRMLLREHENPASVGVLNRLAIVGTSGMGALEYRPAHSWPSEKTEQDFDKLAEECKKILSSTAESGDLDTLFQMGGSSGGARPKVFVNLNGEDWLVKFPSSADPPGIGLMEYEYAQCAARCGISVAECRLFPSRTTPGYFGTRRFDREKLPDGRLIKHHMASVSALLDISHRIPSLDYHSLMALTWQLTKDARELDALYRLMCFNVFAHNRDDHSKNFSFLYKSGRWTLSPAYDLTRSDSIGGEHATTVDGNGRDPGLKELLAVASKAGLNSTYAKQTAEEIRDRVQSDLHDYLGHNGTVI